MEVFQYAMNMEKEGEEYYRELANNTDKTGLKKIFIWLADEEVKHYNILENMKKEIAYTLIQAPLLRNAKTIFAKMRQEKTFDFDASQITMYRKAQDIEKKTQDYYLKEANRLSDARQRETLIKIAKEEEKHYLLLDNIIELVSRPQTWLENAEFYHLDEY